MSEKQEVFWVTIIIAALAVIFLAAFMLSVRSQQSQSQESVYAGIPPDMHLLRLDKQALDEAYHAQLLVLFNVWMKGQASDSQYFQNGLRNARRAYNQASSAILAREQILLEQQKQEELKKQEQQPAEQPK